MLKKHWPTILIAFVLPLVLVFWWWGGFNTVTITETQRGPYHFAYLDHEGDYSKLPETQSKVRKALDEQKVPRGAAITVLFDDPRKVQRSRLRAQTGYLIDPAAQVGGSVRVGTIPTRPVLVASVHAAALLAPSKAYQALHDHLKARQQEIRMPTVEIYDSPAEVYRVGELSVEMER